MAKVIHKEMRRAVKQRAGAPVHAMGDGSTSSVAGIPRGTDDDDNDMQNSDLLCRPSHRITYHGEWELLDIE